MFTVRSFSVARRVGCLAAAITALFLALPAWGQSTFGSFVGTVRDTSGAVVPNCIVTLINTGTSAQRSTVSDKDGSYVLVNIEPGMYRISMQAPGFQVAEFPNLELTSHERRAFHDPAPKWMLGHTSYLTYGNLDFSFTLRAYLGNWVYNNVSSNLGTYSEVTRASPYNLHSSVLTTGFTQPQYLSDYYVEDASFLRMDNITLGYTFRYHGNPLRVFGTVQNAFTLTGYSGVDPTAGLNGIDNNIYPRSRKFTGGLNVRF